MSTQSSREEREAEQHEASPACDTSLTGSTTQWQERPAAAYPPGYPHLCEDCFGPHVPDEAWNEDGTADWDHTEVLENLVCSSQQGTARRYHLPEGVEVER